MSGADGVVAVEVKLETKNFEQQIKQVENELTSLQKKEEFLLEINEKMNKSHARQFTISAKTLQKMQELGLTMEDIGNSQAFTKLQEQIEKTNNKLITLKQKQEEIDKAGKGEFVKTLKNVGNETGNIIKKVARWGLAIFSIRSAYMLVRQAVSTISQYDEKIGADIQYIRFALASALKPIVETIINLVYKLLTYIGYIAKAWFGVNIFANATAKAFQKVNSGVKDTNKSAKQLQKTLAGFDEMNILQDTGATTTGGGGGGVGLPTQDLSDLSNVKIPHWLEVLGENGETIKNIIIGIAEAFALWKILTIADQLGILAQTITGLGIITLLVGIGKAIVDVINGEPIVKIIQDLSIALIGLSGILLGLNKSNPFGWLTLAIGVLGLVGSAFGDTKNEIISVEDATKNLEEAQRGVNEAYQEYTNASKTHLNAYKNYEKAQKNLTKTAKELKISEDKLKGIGEELFEGIRNGTIDINTLKRGEEDLTKTYGLSKDQLMKVYESYVDVKDSKARLETATDKLTTSEEKLTGAQKKQIQEQLTQQLAIANTTKNFNDYRDSVIEAYEKGAISGEEASTRLIGALQFIDKENRQTFVNDIPADIQQGMKNAEWYFDKSGVEWKKTTSNISTNAKNTFGKDVPNYVQKSIDKVKALSNALKNIDVAKGVGAVAASIKYSKNAKGAIYYPPKLAVGGIINQPGRGVPLAMGGERGAEGVIPLTDAQQMQRLGEAIGRYITVNANITNTMNGRVISRELQQIQNESDFAFNR